MSKRKLGSVQKSFVPIREIGENYTALKTPHLSQKQTLCAVLEVQGINYILKSEEEQHLINDVFRVILAGLTYPIQVLMRIQPFSLEKYIQTLQAEHTPWKELTTDYISFIRGLSQEQVLLQRRFYMVIPSGLSAAEDGSTSLLQTLLQRGWNKDTLQEEFAQSHQRLNLRCIELTRQLNAMGLSVQRLGQADLVQLEYSMIFGESAQGDLVATRSFKEVRHLTKHADHATALPFQFTETKSSKREKKKRVQEGLLLWSEIADLLAPNGIAITPSLLHIDSEWLQVIRVFSLPRRVKAGWFNLLTRLDPVDISLYYQPLATAKTMRQLQRKRFEAATNNELDTARGRLQPESRIAQSDIEDLMTRISSGQDRLLEFSMLLLMRGASKKEVLEKTNRVQLSLKSMLLESRVCLFEQDRAFRSSLPHGRNEIDNHAPLALASHEASATFPFLSHNLMMEEGILEGITMPGNEPIIANWWHKEYANANRLIVGPSGRGKSFKAKLDIIRAHLWYGQKKALAQHLPTYQTLIVDIEREYHDLTHRLGGQWLRIAPGTHHYLNPFDLPQSKDRAYPFMEDLLAERVAFLQSLLEIMLAEPTSNGPGRLTNDEKSILDQALYACYQRKGITRDPTTHHLTPPLLVDLLNILQEEVNPEKQRLAQRLHRFVYGSLAGIFAKQTNIVLEEKSLICFDIHDVPKELHPISLFLISGYVWNLTFQSLLPRQFIVDEILTIYQYEEGKQFLESLFQRARKHYLSVVGITQYPKILLDSTIPTNCATNIIMAQELASLPLICEVFHLSDTEMQLVRSFAKGEALLLVNDTRFAVRFVASDLEYSYCTSDPTDLTRSQQKQENFS